MPSLSFAKENAMRLLSLPLYALGGLASAVAPRRADLWVFGCGSGLGEGALELFRYASTANPALRLVWLARNEHERREAARLGMTSVLRSSWRGFTTTLRARVIVVTHGLGDANRFATRGGFVVQMWHGIPLKKIQLDSPVTFRSRLVPSSILKWLYRRNTSAIQFVPAAGPLSAARLATGFGVPRDRVLVTGDPRDDVLFRDSVDARSLLDQKLGRLDFARLILYAPTWRDGDEDPVIPSNEEWHGIIEHLEANNSALVIRPHPHSVGDYGIGARLSNRIRILPAAVQNDVTPVLASFDLLVTDYSSIAYDFALTGRPIAFLAPDVAEYTASRGLYESYQQFSGGTEVSSWPALLAMIGDPAAVAALRRHSAELADRHHAFRDGRNTERVYVDIIQRLKGHA